MDGTWLECRDFSIHIGAQVNLSWWHPLLQDTLDDDDAYDSSEPEAAEAEEGEPNNLRQSSDPRPADVPSAPEAEASAPAPVAGTPSSSSQGMMIGFTWKSMLILYFKKVVNYFWWTYAVYGGWFSYISCRLSHLILLHRIQHPVSPYMTMEELMGPSSWKKQRNGWKSWGLSVFFMGTRWKWSLLYINLCFLYVYIFLQLSKFKSGTFSPWTIHINPALYIKPLVCCICLGFGPERPHWKNNKFIIQSLNNMPQALVYTGNHACINCFCITGNYYHGYACLTEILMYNVYNLSLPLQVLQGTMWILCLCPETSLLWPRQPQLPLFPQSHPHQSGMRMSAVPTTKMWHCQAPLHPLLRLWKRWCQHRLLQSQRLTRRSFIVGWFQNWFIYIYNIYIYYIGVASVDFLYHGG